jgi:fumarylacetoacetase
MPFTIDPTIRSWIPVPADHDFSIQNLPFAVMKTREGGSAVCTAVGDQIINMAALHKAGIFSETAIGDSNVFATDSLNALMTAGRRAWTDVRQRLCDVLKEGGDPALKDNEELRNMAIQPLASAALNLPVQIGDFTDFYSSKYHATNVGIMFRGKENALMPNWLHLPVGYHGRASTVFPSGFDIKRPCGQTKADDADAPSYGPSGLLDFELEMGFFVGKANDHGTRVATDQVDDHIFGMVLVNDWSARDLQKWEYQPLGPFLGKSFATTISPWVVTLDALEPFKTVAQPRDVPVLPYLEEQSAGAYDIELEAHVQNAKMSEPMRLTRTNFKHMYWTIAQQLAHHTVNGTAMRVGDLCGSGTISGPTEDSLGSMLELCWKGTKPMTLPDGTERKFFADGDTVSLTGWCQGDGYRVGFGECRATILPATP